MWNNYDYVGRKTNNDVERFDRYVNKYLHTPHPNIFKFIDHLKTIQTSTVLNVNDFRRNPLEFVAYVKPKKAIKEDYEFQRMKEALETKKLSLNEYAVTAKITAIDYIHEWLSVDLIDEYEDLNNVVNDCTIEVRKK